MLQEPVVRIVVIHEEGGNGEDQGGDQQAVVVVHEECVADADTNGNTRLTAEEIHALRGSTLTMTTQLDEEQQEPRPDNTY